MENLTNEEKDYYELLADMLDDGVIDESERNILNKRKNKYSISDNRAKEIEDFAIKEYLESKTPQFETDGERDYYELLVDMLEDGNISDSGRNILNKRKDKYGISDSRAKELENMAMKNNNIDLENSNIENISNSISSFTETEFNDIKNLSITLLNNLNRSYEYEDDIKRNCFEAYNEFKKMNKTPKENYEDYPEEYYKFVETLLDKFYEIGEYEAVIGITKKLEKYCLNKYIIRIMGIAYARIQSFKKSKNAFITLVALDEEDDYSWFLLADAYLNLDDYDNAIECYEKAININNNIAVYWNDYGVSLERVNRLEEAKNCYKRAAELEPNEKLYSNNLNKVKVGRIIKGIGDLFK